MKKRLLFFILVLSLSIGSVIVISHFSGDQASAVPSRWNILMLGDSITEFGTGLLGGYPEAYVQKLRNSFGTDTVFKFIGRKGTTAAPREGYQGKTSKFISDILNDGNSNGLHPYLHSNIPDVVLLHISTNDVWNLTLASTVKTNIKNIITKLKHFNPNVKVCLAQIIPYRAIVPFVPGADQIVFNYNYKIFEIGIEMMSNVTVVDQNTGFLTSYSYDGLHPNSDGQNKMANEWMDHCPCVYQYE